jgi:hypothetical protein
MRKAGRQEKIQIFPSSFPHQSLLIPWFKNEEGRKAGKDSDIPFFLPSSITLNSMV